MLLHQNDNQAIMLHGEEKKDSGSPPLDATGVANPLAASGAPPAAAVSVVPMSMQIEFSSAPPQNPPPPPSAGAAAAAAAVVATGTTPAGVPNPIMASPIIMSFDQSPIVATQTFFDDPTTPAVGLGSTVPSPLASPILSPPILANPIYPSSRPASTLTVGTHATSASTMEAMEMAMNDIIEVEGETSYEPPANRRRSNSIHWERTATTQMQTANSNGSWTNNESLQPVNFGDGGVPQPVHFSPGTAAGTVGMGTARKLSNASSYSSMGIRSTSSNSLHSNYSEYSENSGGGSLQHPLAGINPVAPTGSAVATGSVGGVASSAMRPHATTVTAVRTVNYTTGPNTSITTAAPTVGKRQKRLERNRESARASRRRRKHYLEELEVKVTKLSEDMDRGRINHACMAVRTVRGMRIGKLREAERILSASAVAATGAGAPGMAGCARPPGVKSGIAHNVTTSSGIAHNVTSLPRPLPPPNSQPLEQITRSLTSNLSRTSDELQMVQTFMKQQLLSLVQPTSTKFMLWLSLQKDGFYRGGRSASERLSAARIGERMLHGGTYSAPPNNGMWPLTCHEISLSYEQEDKIRQCQRSLLAKPETWINRHTALATQNVVESIHDTVGVTQQAAKKREQSLMSILTPEQRVKFLAWAGKRSDTIRRLAEANLRGRVASSAASSGQATPAAADSVGDGTYKTSRDRHVAANLYIIDHLLSKVKQRAAAAASSSQPQQTTTMLPSSFIPPNKLKKLSRRPAFESLAVHQNSEDGLSREMSFPSTGSLKRSLNDMAIGDNNIHDHNNIHDPMMMCSVQNNGVTPESAQAAGQAAVMAVFKDVMPLVPKSAWCSYPPSTATSVAATTTARAAPYHNPATVVSQPQAYQSVAAAAPPPQRKPRDQQPRWNTMPTPIEALPQPMAAATFGIAAQQPPPPPGDDLSGVDDIPMPTPFSVLLRTSDDFMSPPLYEHQQQQELLDAYMPPPSAIPGTDFPIPEQVSSFLAPTTASNTTGLLLSSRHQSAPAFTYPSSLAAPMAMIPESYNLVVNNPTVMEGGLGPSNFVPGDLVDDFGLDDLPLYVDDWEIGEGFDMDMDQGAA